jgi:hypothetical protein
MKEGGWIGSKAILGEALRRNAATQLLGIYTQSSYTG